MKKTKISTGKAFPKGISKIVPAPKQEPDKRKFMTDKERVKLNRRLDHYEKTKDLPTI